MSIAPEPEPTRAPHAHAKAYWTATLRFVAVLLVAWFAVSFGAGILLAPTLDAVRVPGTGFPLGFWFAQQGSIYGFVIIVAVYVFGMRRIDRRFGVED